MVLSERNIGETEPKTLKRSETMSMEDYLAAVELIKSNGGGDFSGNKSDWLIEKAESALNLKFPPTYRRFLKEFGCGGIAGEDFYGIVDDNFTNSGVPDGIWYTIAERIDSGLSHEFILINSLGDGTEFALDTSYVNDDGEYPVVWLTLEGQIIEDVAEDFGKFFYDEIQDAIADLKSPPLDFSGVSLASDRKAFKSFRRAYWKRRAKDFD